MKNNILTSIFALLFCFNCSAFSQAISVTQLFNIGNGKLYVCASDAVFGNFIGRKVTETSASYLDYRRARRNAFRKLRFYRNKKSSSVDLTRRRLRRLNNRIRNWRKTYRELRKCWIYDDAFNSLSDDQDPDIQRACEIISPETGGFRNMKVVSRIFNGNRCDLNESAIVKINMYSDQGNEGSCSATAVTKRALITAAHCLDGGVTSVKVISQNQTLESEDFHMHPDYDRRAEDSESNDVAVILLDEDIATDLFKPIKDISLVLKELGIIAGYGYDEFFDAGNLIAAPILVDSFSTQRITIRYTNNNDFGNTCSGDSGGPLLIKRDDTWRLVGVTSNGVNPNCGAGDVSNFANLLDPTNISFFETHIPDLY